MSLTNKTVLATEDQITPNVVMPNPNARRRLGVALWVLNLAAGIAGLFFAFFPEATFGTDIPARAIAFTNALVSIVSAAFGLIVTTPNVPKA